jgi:hypothetical protein
MMTILMHLDQVKLLSTEMETRLEDNQINPFISHEWCLTAQSIINRFSGTVTWNFPSHVFPTIAVPFSFPSSPNVMDQGNEL